MPNPLLFETIRGIDRGRSHLARRRPLDERIETIAIDPEVIVIAMTINEGAALRVVAIETVMETEIEIGLDLAIGTTGPEDGTAVSVLRLHAARPQSRSFTAYTMEK